MIIETIYNNHYIRWYKRILSDKDKILYYIEQLKDKIFNNLNDELI